MPRKAEAAFDNSEWYNLLGLNISYYRRRAGLTQEQLADLVECGSVVVMICCR